MSATDGHLRHIWTNDVERENAMRLDAVKELVAVVNAAAAARGAEWALPRACEIIANLCYKLSVAELAGQLSNAVGKYRKCACGGYEPIHENTAYAKLMDLVAAMRGIMQETTGVAGYSGRGIVTPWSAILEYKSYANNLRALTDAEAFLRDSAEKRGKTDAG